MAKYERFGVNAVARLVDPISNSATTLEVTTTDGFPTDGNFRITIGREILLVTAISGSVFTVARGQEGSTAVAHDGGAPVRQTITAGALKQLGLDNIPLFQESSRPQLNRLVDSSGGVLTTSSFTAINSASGTNLNSGGIYLNAPASASHNIRAYSRSYTAPFTVTAAFVPHLHNAVNTNYCGIGFRDNTIGDLMFFVTATGGNIVGPPVATQGADMFALYDFTSPTSFNASVVGRQNWFMGRTLQWMQIEDNNTNLYFRLSMDGINWFEVHSEARTTTLATPDHVFFGTHSGTDNDFNTAMTLVAWEEA